MRNINQWPIWLQLLIGIPNAIVLTVLLWIWWPTNMKEFKRYRIVTIPYIILVFLFYLIFIR